MRSPSNEAVYHRYGRLALIAFNCITFAVVVWAIAIENGFPYRLGVDGQRVHCLPWSVYLIKRTPPDGIEIGDLVQFRAGALGYGFEGRLFVKMVAAKPGDTIEIRDDYLYINGTARDRLWLLKTMKKAPRSFDRTFVVGPDELFMLGTLPESYDGRYWGAINRSQILGTATPLF